MYAKKFALSLSYETPAIHSESRAIKTLLMGTRLGRYLAQTQPVTMQSGFVADANGNG